MPEPFNITSHRMPDGIEHLGTLTLWRRWAGPKSAKHWRSGRSAMEVAKAWRSGVLPMEIREGLAGTPFAGFDPESGTVEEQQRFDSRPGEGRNHDLILRGKVGGQRSIIDIEGKADEEFGGTLATIDRKGSSGQKARVRHLSQAMFACAPNDPAVAQLRYQLLFGLYATAQLAASEGSRMALFLVQVFVSEACSGAKIVKGRRDLNRFLRCVSRDRLHLAKSSPVVGPLTTSSAGTWVPDNVELWVGRIETWQAPPKR